MKTRAKTNQKICKFLVYILNAKESEYHFQCHTKVHQVLCHFMPFIPQKFFTLFFFNACKKKLWLTAQTLLPKSRRAYLNITPNPSWKWAGLKPVIAIFITVYLEFIGVFLVPGDFFVSLVSQIKYIGEQ